MILLLAPVIATGVVVAIAPAITVGVLAVPALLAAVVSPFLGLLVVGFAGFAAATIAVSTFKITVVDLALLLPATGLLVRHIARKRALMGGTFLKLTLGFVLTALVSLLAARDPIEGLIGTAQLVEVVVVPTVLIAELLTTPRRRRVFVDVSATGLLLGAAIATWQMLETYRVTGEAFAVSRGLAGGFQGYFMALGLVYCLATLLRRERPFGFVPLAVTAAAGSLFLLALVESQIRGGWVAAVVGIATLAGIHYRRTALALPAVVLVVVLGTPLLEGILPQPLVERAIAVVDADASRSSAATESNLIRLELARIAVSMWLSEPIVGIGMKNFRAELFSVTGTTVPLAIEMPGLGLVNVDGPHNYYLRVLAEQGVLGVLVLAALGAYILRAAYIFRKRPAPSDQFIGDFSLAASAVVAVFCLFLELVATGALLFVFCILIPAAAPAD